MKTIVTFFRLLRTGFVLARHDALVPEEYAKRVPWIVRMLGWISRIFARKDRAKNPGERFANALEKLGPAYIKFGQVLSTRSDILDPEFARGLSRLKDRVPPFPKSQALARLDKELGHSWTQDFQDISEPVAAASVAQVHKGTLKDGTELAIKILRPNIRTAMARDMEVLSMVAGLANRFLPDANRLRPRQFVETVKRAVTLELDLRLEAAAASELGEIALETGAFKVPKIYWAMSDKNVLVMAWADGLSLANEAVLADDTIDRKALARAVIQSFLICAFDYGVFHADMHEGNLVVDTDGDLVLLDFGILGRLSPAEQRFHAEILYGFLKRDYQRIAEIHFEAGYVPAAHTIEDFASALRAVGEPIFGKTSDEVSMSKVLMQLFEITDIFDMQMQPQLIMLQKTMMQAEGVARRLDPEFDMWATAKPVVEATMRRELGPEGRLDDFLDDLRAAQKTLKTLPGAADNLAALAKAWADGEIDLSPKTSMPDNTKPRALLKPVVWTTFGVIIALGGIWAAGQI